MSRSCAGANNRIWNRLTRRSGCVEHDGLLAARTRHFVDRARLLCRAACLAACLAGCGEDPPASPAEKCEALLGDICDRAVVCVAAEVGSHENCIQLLHEENDCSAAVRVNDNYDTCATRIGEASCTALFTINPQDGEPTVNLPAECLGVFETSEERTAVGAPRSLMQP
jgi:hypothetical protein